MLDRYKKTFEDKLGRESGYFAADRIDLHEINLHSRASAHYIRIRQQCWS